MAKFAINLVKVNVKRKVCKLRSREILFCIWLQLPPYLVLYAKSKFSSIYILKDSWGSQNNFSSSSFLRINCTMKKVNLILSQAPWSWVFSECAHFGSEEPPNSGGFWGVFWELYHLLGSPIYLLGSRFHKSTEFNTCWGYDIDDQTSEPPTV